MSHTDCTHTIRPRYRPLRVDLGALAWFGLRWSGYRVARAVELGLVWLERAQQRRHLRELDDPMLRDIGLSRADAWAEAEKPFWRP